MSTQRALEKHALMYKVLDEQTVTDFRKIKYFLKTSCYITEREFEEAQSMYKILEYLEKNPNFELQLGKYDKLKEVLSQFDKRSVGIIDEYDDQIKKILAESDRQNSSIDSNDTDTSSTSFTVLPLSPSKPASPCFESTSQIPCTLSVENNSATSIQKISSSYTESFPPSLSIKALDCEESSSAEPYILYPFQQELTEKAKNGENTIIYSGTNSGKTLVAFEIIRHHLATNTSGKVVFMARTLILLDSQYKKANKELHDRKNEIVHIKDTESDCKKLVDEFKTKSVLFMTPQKLVNILDEKKEHHIKIGDLTLLIFDECHHTFGRNPYNIIMSKYRQEKYSVPVSTAFLPQIVGLSASPARRGTNAKEEVLQLMANLDVIDLSTVIKHKDDVFYDEPEIVKLTVNSRDDDAVQNILIKTMERVESILSDEFHKHSITENDEERGSLLPPDDRTLPDYEQWIHSKIIQVGEKKFNNSLIGRFFRACCRHLKAYYWAVQTNLTLDYIDVKDYLKQKYDEFETECTAECLPNEKELVALMKNVIDEVPDKVGTNPDIANISITLEAAYKENKEESRFLIFIQRKIAAKKLAEKLPKCLRSYHLTGYQNSKSMEYKGMTLAEQDTVLEKFRKGEHLCLVATSVAAEGLDIPACNFTMEYKIDANSITSAQMKGRNRQKSGTHFKVGCNNQMRKFNINIQRIAQLKDAVEEIVKNNHYRKIVIDLQRAVYERENQIRNDEVKQTKREAPFEIHCKKCDGIICKGDEIRTVGNNHRVVMNKEIFTRIQRYPLNRCSNAPGFQKVNKIRGPCNHEWGVILSSNSVEMAVLAQDSIRIYNTLEEQYEPAKKKWSQYDIKIKSCTDEEFEEYKNS